MEPADAVQRMEPGVSGSRGAGRNPARIRGGQMQEMERATGVEPASEAWEASILPMNYARMTRMRLYQMEREAAPPEARFPRRRLYRTGTRGAARLWRAGSLDTLEPCFSPTATFAPASIPAGSAWNRGTRR